MVLGMRPPSEQVGHHEHSALDGERSEKRVYCAGACVRRNVTV
jgi:hypothetical protein